jgi:uncharacterized protein (DUF302 family)
MRGAAAAMLRPHRQPRRGDMTANTATANEGSLVEIASPFAFEATLARIADAIEAAHLTIFARIDHAANAQEVGLTMPPTTVLIYGAAKGGTPLMLVAPQSALDLPLRVLVRESETGVYIAFHPMAPVLLKAGVAESLTHKLDPAQGLLAQALRQ